MRLDLSLGYVALTLLVAACDGGSGTPSFAGIGGATSVGTTSTDVASGGTPDEGSNSESSTGGTSPATSDSNASKGGATAAGGTSAASSSQATGGSKPAAGGSPATGGTKAATGGTQATTTYVDNPTVCDDTATTKSEMSAQFSRVNIKTTNNPNKSYVAITNWWGVFTDQTVAVDGIGFKVGNTNAKTTNNNPIGFPTIFIGTYQNNASTGSNLPKQLSAISSIPTVFDTNATSLDTSNFNASYDVWLTANNTPLSGTNASSPGTGGAYVMVWLYDPASRQPRGSVKASAQTIGKTSNTWDVWVDPAGTQPLCISYVAKTPVSALTFDLLDFLKDSTKYGVTNSMYLSIVFAGFEIWNGGNGATVNKFCAKVN